uniref:Uncharacterized protein n=1 Tax=Cannabis sativa TaxID=3483 RepID=A0A803P1J8_CANSA
MGSATIGKNVRRSPLDKEECICPCDTDITMFWQRGQHLTGWAQASEDSHVTVRRLPNAPLRLPRPDAPP